MPGASVNAFDIHKHIVVRIDDRFVNKNFKMRNFIVFACFSEFDRLSIDVLEPLDG